jgi:hypothetical protein
MTVSRWKSIWLSEPFVLKPPDPKKYMPFHTPETIPEWWTEQTTCVVAGWDQEKGFI